MKRDFVPEIIKIDYVGGSQPIYIGRNADPSASDDNVDWKLSKLTWVGENITTVVKRTGTWTGRVALFA